MPLIRTESLTKIYGKGETAVTALDRVNLGVNAGEFVAVMGPSGCGKSTLISKAQESKAGRVAMTRPA